MVVAQVDCIKNNDICNAQEIRKFPSLILYLDGERVKEYPDWKPRKKAHFKKFLEEFFDPQAAFKEGDILPLTQGNMRRIIGKNQLTFVQFYTTMCWTCVHWIRSTLVKFAQEMKTKYQGQDRPENQHKQLLICN